MSEENRGAAQISDDAEVSVSEALADLEKVAGLLEKWDRQPNLLSEVETLKKKLEGLLSTLKDFRLLIGKET